MINWGTVLAIFLAIVGASLVEHMVIAPRMAHSPARMPFGKGVLSTLQREETVSEYVRSKYPNAVTI